jgi:hypothetical protein
MVQYLSLHQNINILNCSAAAIQEAADLEQISIYPNPSSNLVNVVHANSSDTFTIQFINATGATVLSVANQKTINIADFPKGIYLVKIVGTKKTYGTQKLIIE